MRNNAEVGIAVVYQLPQTSDRVHVYAMRATASTMPRRQSTLVNRDEILQLITDCNTVLTKEPGCLHTRTIRGHAYMKAKMWNRAVEDFTAILDARPDDVHGRFSRGMALFKQGYVKAAHDDFSVVLECHPEHVMARYARAGCYNTEGKFHHAIQEYNIALHHDERENDRHEFRSDKLPRGRHEGISNRIVLDKRSRDDARRLQKAQKSPNRIADDNKQRSPQARTHHPSLIEVSAVPHSSVVSPGQQNMNVPPKGVTLQPPTPTATATEMVAKPRKPRKVVQVCLNLTPSTAPILIPPQHQDASQQTPHIMSQEGALSSRCGLVIPSQIIPPSTTTVQPANSSTSRIPPSNKQERHHSHVPPVIPTVSPESPNPPYFHQVSSRVPTRVVRKVTIAL